MNQSMETLVVDRKAILGVEPLLKFEIACEALWSVSSAFEGVEDRLWQQSLARFATRRMVLQQAFDASLFIQGKPAGDGLAMDTKLRGDINASGCLLTSEEHQHLQSLLVVGITFFAVEFLEGLIILLDDRAGSVAHCSFLPNLSLWWDVAKNWYEIRWMNAVGISHTSNLNFLPKILGDAKPFRAKQGGAPFGGSAHASTKLSMSGGLYPVKPPSLPSIRHSAFGIRHSPFHHFPSLASPSIAVDSARK